MSKSIRVKRKVQVDEGPFNERALKSKNVGARALKFVIVHESLEKQMLIHPLGYSRKTKRRASRN